MQQEPQSGILPASSDIQAAPPAYSPPMPVKDVPTDPSATDKASPSAPVADQQPGHSPTAGVTPLNQLGSQPQWIDCPFCQRRTMTRVNKEGTPMQIVAGVLCCLLCVCLACVPCLAGWFEETSHFCSQCHNKVATRRDDGPVAVYGPAAVVPSKYAQG